jgi:hypothetical protein
MEPTHSAANNPLIAAGVNRPRGKARISADAQLIPFIVEAFTAMARDGRGDIAIAGAVAALEALERRGPKRQRAPGAALSATGL